MIIETNTPQETYAVGKKIGENAKPGQIYTLTGDLGVGKTVFTQGVAAGLNITEPINSPTFTIIQEYESGRLPLYHFDVYRIGDIEEMEEIGYDDYFFGQGICLIEWANLIEEILPENLIKVTIEKDLEKGFDYRKITITGLEEIGYDDYFFGQGICLIEWADLIEEILPEKLIKVTIEKDLEKGFDYRRITVIGPENS